MAVTLVCIFIIMYVYSLYGLLISFFARLARGKTGPEPVAGYLPSVTVLLTVHDENEKIGPRIKNLLDLEYPQNRLQILVASDGSTDGTNEIVEKIEDDRVELFATRDQAGKTACQNLALARARGEIIVFTDAGTSFDRGFVSEVVKPLGNPVTGAVNGHLIFVAGDQSGSLAPSQGFYWNYELLIRQAESRLGILAVVSGACFAVKKALLRQMNPATGEDCIVPLDVVDQGFYVVHEPRALAYEQLDGLPEQEFRARVRMTLRNWQGTWSMPQLLNPVRNPGVSFALWSHKILRWLSPFFLITTIIAANLIPVASDSRAVILTWIVNCFVLLAFIGWIATSLEIRLPVVKTIYNFFLANAGFLMGVVLAMRKHKVHAYRS